MDGEINDNQMKDMGYIEKTFLFYAFKDIPTSDEAKNHHFARVCRWWHASDKDWVSLVENIEGDDELLKSWGYTSKICQYYVLII